MTEKQILETYNLFQQAMIDKDLESLRLLTSSDIAFRHMSGKVQTREEFFFEIMDGTLNYYQSTLLDKKIEIKNGIGNLIGKTRLQAKVYGMSGSWDMKISQWYKEENGKIILINKPGGNYE